MARLSLRQSNSLRNPQMDGPVIPRETQGRDGGRRKAKQRSDREKPIFNAIPQLVDRSKQNVKWTVSTKNSQISETKHLGSPNRDGMAEGSSSQEQTNSGHETRKHARAPQDTTKSPRARQMAGRETESSFHWRRHRGGWGWNADLWLQEEDRRRRLHPVVGMGSLRLLIGDGSVHRWPKKSATGTKHKDQGQMMG